MHMHVHMQAEAEAAKQARTDLDRAHTDTRGMGRDLEAETRRVQQLTRELATAAAERVALQMRLKSMHETVERHSAEVLEAREEAATLRGEVQQAERDLRADQGDEREGRNRVEAPPQQLEQLQPLAMLCRPTLMHPLTKLHPLTMLHPLTRRCSSSSRTQSGRSRGKVRHTTCYVLLTPADSLYGSAPHLATVEAQGALLATIEAQGTILLTTCPRGLHTTYYQSSRRKVRYSSSSLSCAPWRRRSRPTAALSSCSPSSMPPSFRSSTRPGCRSRPSRLWNGALA